MSEAGGFLFFILFDRAATVVSHSVSFLAGNAAYASWCHLYLPTTSSLPADYYFIIKHSNNFEVFSSTPAHPLFNLHAVAAAAANTTCALLKTLNATGHRSTTSLGNAADWSDPCDEATIISILAGKYVQYIL